MEIFGKLSTQAQEVLKVLGESGSGQIKFEQVHNSAYFTKFSVDGRILATEADGRRIEFYRVALEELDQWKLVNRAYDAYNLTTKGDEVYQVNLEQSRLPSDGVKTQFL